MLKDVDILATPDIHQLPSLYICSNTDAGEAPFTAFWQQQLATLKHETIPFQFRPNAPQPTLLLDIEQHPRLPKLLEHHDAYLRLLAILVYIYDSQPAPERHISLPERQPL